MDDNAYIVVPALLTVGERTRWRVSARCALRTRVREREREREREGGKEGGGHQPQRSPGGGARPAVEEIGAEPTRSRGGRVGDECGAMEVNTTGEGVFRG
jgi:hypothetical protein